MTESGNEQLEECIYLGYIDMMDLFTEGMYNDADEFKYIQIYYLLFLFKKVKF